MPKYKLTIIPGNLWQDKILTNYHLYYTQIKPRNECVTFLVFSGISHLGTKSIYFSKEMCSAYAEAFQVHQRPYKTKEIHKYWINSLPYFWYLWLIAVPIDVFVHISQFFVGETGAFLEGGAFFIPYMILHWFLLLITLRHSFIV